MAFGLTEDGMMVSRRISDEKGFVCAAESDFSYSIPTFPLRCMSHGHMSKCGRRILDCPMQSEGLKEGRDAGEALAYQKFSTTTLVW
jgi:hypothetical protein